MKLINTNTKLLAAILIPMLLIPLASFGYAHWTDSVTKQIKMHVGYVDASVKSYKCVSEFDDDWIMKDPPEPGSEYPEGIKTLRIWTDRAFPGWWVWIGLIIQNQGPFPVEVDVPHYKVTMTPSDSVSYTHEEYFYGPYTTKEWQTAKKTNWDFITWKYLKEYGAPPGDVDVPPPIYLEAYGPHVENRMVLWIFIELIDAQEGFVIEIEISLHTVLALP